MSGRRSVHVLASPVVLSALAIAASSCGSTEQTSAGPASSSQAQGARNVPLVIDALNEPGLPRNFRIAAPSQPTKGGQSVDLTGLAELRESGSGVFSAAGLRTIRDKIGASPIVDVDLRQESHLYVNGIAVSWFGKNDDANLGMSYDQVLADEGAKKAELVGAPTVKFAYIAGKSVQPNGSVGNPKVVQTEQEVADAAGFGYFHLTVPDHYRPQNEQVDRFVAFVRDLPPNTWLHFHCRAGVGRTTTFMAMYDMLRDAKTLSMNDILRRQVAVGGKDLLGGDVSGNDNKTERVQFLRQFYDYAQTNLDGFQTPFTAWLAAGGR